MISYLWPGNGNMWSFDSLPFPSSHSHSHEAGSCYSPCVAVSTGRKRNLCKHLPCRKRGGNASSSYVTLHMCDISVRSRYLAYQHVTQVLPPSSLTFILSTSCIGYSVGLLVGPYNGYAGDVTPVAVPEQES